MKEFAWSVSLLQSLDGRLHRIISLSHLAPRMQQKVLLAHSFFAGIVCKRLFLRNSQAARATRLSSGTGKTARRATSSQAAAALHPRADTAIKNENARNRFAQRP